MKKTGKTFTSGDLVFAKVRGYPPWPARITGSADKNNSKFHVFFFGTYETAVCKKEELWLCDETTKAKYGRNKSKLFPEAMEEMINTPEIALASGDDASTVAEGQPEAKAEPPPPAPQAQAHEGDSSSEDNALVIDEGAKGGGGAKARNRGTKRKAEEAPTTPSQQPPAKQVRVKIAPLPPPEAASPSKPPSTPSTLVVDEKTSRSGRLIKPKKFVDESPQNSPPHAAAAAVALSSAVSPPPPSQAKIATPPKKEDPKPEAVTETPPKPPTEIRFKIVSKENRSPVIEEVKSPAPPTQPLPAPTVPPTPPKKDKETFVASKAEKIRWLRIEQRLSDLNLDLKKSVHFQRPNMEACLQALKELQALAIDPFMLKKQPDVILTVRRLQKYCGPSAQSMDPLVNETRTRMSEAIRTEAAKVFTKMKSLFGSAIKNNFVQAFEDEVAAFREATKAMQQQDVDVLFKDPSE